MHFPQIHQRQATRDTLLARATVLELLRDRLRYRRYLFPALVADRKTARSVDFFVACSSGRRVSGALLRLLDGGTESDLSDLVYRDGKSRPVQAFRKRVERWSTRGVSRLFERQRRRRRMLIASSGSGTSRGERSRYRRRWIPCFQEHTSEKLADGVQEKEASAGIEHLER